MPLSTHSEATDAAVREVPAGGAGPGLEPGGLRVECVDTFEGLERLADEWNALLARTPDPLPFRTHEWAAAWWTHLRRDGRMVRDLMRTYVVRDVSGAAVAFAPYMLTHYRLLGVTASRILQPIGADPNLTELRGMLVAPRDEHAALDALRAHVERDGGYDWVRWAGLRRDTGAAAAMRGHPKAYVERQTSAFRLPLPATWEEFRKSRPRNVRESLRKCYNSLARDGHAWTFRCLEDASEIRGALGRFFDLHGRRAAADAGVPHADHFASPQARTFLADVVARAGQRGRVRMFQLEIGGAPVAMRLGFLYGDELYLYYSGYEPAWGRYSVMTTVVAEAIQRAIELGVRSVHLSTGADVSKTRWRPQEHPFEDVVVVAEGARARLAHRAFRYASQHHTLRSLPAPRPQAAESATMMVALVSNLATG